MISGQEHALIFLELQILDLVLTMSIYLIRHAQSEANINGRTRSHAAIVLSEQGKQQAEQLCEVLPTIDHVIISKYQRTYQTAQPILHKYHITAEVDHNLHEFSYLSERNALTPIWMIASNGLIRIGSEWIMTIGMPMMRNLLLTYMCECNVFMKN